MMETKVTNIRCTCGCGILELEKCEYDIDDGEVDYILSYFIRAFYGKQRDKPFLYY